jgi:hypothetical protein
MQANLDQRAMVQLAWWHSKKQNGYNGNVKWSAWRYLGPGFSVCLSVFSLN